MFRYSQPLYRPPAEADNIIVQATYGCSHNRCSFCTMYKSKKYEARALKEVFEEIDTLAEYSPDARRLFLADGDALALPAEHLTALLHYAKRAFPRLNRVSLYATAQNLLEKSDEELSALRKAGLKLLYFGIESGSDALLQKIEKGVTSAEITEAMQKASKAGMKLSATVILGLGGTTCSDEHITATAALINTAAPNYLSTLQLGLEEGAKAKFYRAFDDFQMLDDAQTLEEQKRLLELLNPSQSVIFRSNHASNALHLAGTLPKDTPRLIDEVKRALEMGEHAFIPKFFRGF